MDKERYKRQQALKRVCDKMVSLFGVSRSRLGFDSVDLQSVMSHFDDAYGRIFDYLAKDIDPLLGIDELSRWEEVGNRMDREFLPFLQTVITAFEKYPDAQPPPDVLRELAEQVTLKANLALSSLKSVEGKIDIDTIELIHGIEERQDGYVNFARHINNEHQDLAGVPVGRLREYLPQLVTWLLRDSYFTVNASWRAAAWTNRVTGLPHPHRPDNAIRYLNALYVDCDIYKGKPPMDWPDAAARILRAQDEGVIPYYSIIVRSGRGMYLLWLLRNERQGVYARATSQEIALYKRLSDKLHDVLNAYEPRLIADKSQAGRLLGLLRTPGSEHVKAQVPVLYNVQGVGEKGVPIYQLPELASFFKLPVTPELPRREKATYLSGSGKPVRRPGEFPKKVRGRIVSAERRLRDIYAIAQHNLGIEQGRRYVSLYYLCEFAKTSGRTMTDAQTLAEGFAANCRPPYPSDKADVPVADIVKRVWTERTKGKPLNSDAMARFFDVTPELADSLNLESIIPEATRAARKPVLVRAEARAIRRDIIKAILAEHPGRVPRVRDVQKRLPKPASFTTISADIKAMLANYKLQHDKSQ